MRLLALLGCAFTLGWILSWMYYDTSTTSANSNSADYTALAQTSNAASQSISHANAENDLRQPDKANQTITSASVFDVMLERLKRGEFEAVMAQYPVLQSTLSESDAIKHKRIIVDHARSLLKSGQSVNAYALLSLY